MKNDNQKSPIDRGKRVYVIRYKGEIIKKFGKFSNKGSAIDIMNKIDKFAQDKKDYEVTL